MVRLLKCRYYAAKYCVILVGLLLITLNAYAQEPVWQWATQAGGYIIDHGNEITIDVAGNNYVTGWFEGTATFGSSSLTSSGFSDILVAKVDVNGNWLWATKAGGSGWDEGYGIIIDYAGNCYVTGTFRDTATFGPYSLTSSGASDIFVAEIDADGSWQWATKAGGTGFDGGIAITKDNTGNCYVTGWFGDTATFGSYSLTSGGVDDIFVAKMDAIGNWQWATKAGGISDADRGYGITIDDTGNCYVTGRFFGTATFGSYSLISSGEVDIFVAKMDAIGNWQWATKAGGTGWDIGYAITIDDTGNCYVTGLFEGTATFGSSSLTSSGEEDIFVAKMDAIGNWQWATKAGGYSSDLGNGITIDDSGNTYITGCFCDTATFGSYSLTSSGGYEIFVAKMGAVGNWLWANKAGGTDGDRGYGITIDYDGNCYITGSFRETATFGSYTLNSSGSNDIFVAKLNPPVSTDPEINPDIFNLIHYPNPIKTHTVINYSLKQEAHVHLEIYNLKGQLVETLFRDNIQAGDHTIEWDCQNIPAGVYFLKMKAGSEESIRKMILLR